MVPGDSFTVRLVPPRAGTFVYHTTRTGVTHTRQHLVLHPGARVARMDPEPLSLVEVRARVANAAVTLRIWIRFHIE